MHYGGNFITLFFAEYLGNFLSALKFYASGSAFFVFLWRREILRTQNLHQISQVHLTHVDLNSNHVFYKNFSLDY